MQTTKQHGPNKKYNVEGVSAYLPLCLAIARIVPKSIAILLRLAVTSLKIQTSLLRILKNNEVSCGHLKQVHPLSFLSFQYEPNIVLELVILHMMMMMNTNREPGEGIYQSPGRR